MEYTTVPHPPIMPQSTEQAAYGSVGDHVVTPKIPTTPAPAPGATKKSPIQPWMVIAGIILFIGIFSLLFLQANQTSTTTTTQVPTPTATASAISNRTLTPLATQSAFIKFESDLDTLTRGVQNMQIQNQQLLPPRIDLPLGF
jgi:hypothetical protein